ncbi:MAG: hypothetical protein ABIJ96_03405 [Elusimicrobiota bacterium]
MATPNKSRVVLQYLTLFLACSLVVPAAAVQDEHPPVSDPYTNLRKFTCVTVDYTPNRPGANAYEKQLIKDIDAKKIKPPKFYKRSNDLMRRDEGNLRFQLFRDDRCTVPSSAHVWESKGSQPRLHWASEPGEKPEFNFKSLPISKSNWKVATTGKAVDLNEQQAVAVPPRERVEAPEVGDGVDVTPGGGTRAGEGERDADRGQLGGADNLPQVVARIILDDPAYDKDILKQFLAFIWAPDHGFVRGGFKDEADFNKIVEARVEQRIKKELEKARANKAQADRTAAEIAAMYYIVASNDSPLFANNPILKKFEAKRPGFKSTLLACLRGYRDEAKGAKAMVDAKTFAASCHPRTGKEPPIPFEGVQAADNWLNDFMPISTKSSFMIISAMKYSKEELDQIANANPSDPVIPDGTGGGTPGQLPRHSPNMDINYLFGKWGDKNVFNLDGRRLAIVPRLERAFVGKPPKQQWVQKIGIYDISSPGNVYGKYFDADKLWKEKKFSLTKGGKQYVLDVAAVDGSYDKTISIKRPDGKEPVFGVEGQKMPSLQGLYAMRAEKALASGMVADFGGKKYYVTAESAKSGYFMYWSEETMDKLRRGDLKGLSVLPDGVAEVNKMERGRVVAPQDQVSTGLNVGGVWYDLQRDPNTGIWRPVEGKEPVPAPPPETPGSGTTPSGGQTGTQPNAGPWRDITFGDWKMDKDHPKLAQVNAALDAKGLRVYTYADKDGKHTFILMSKNSVAGSQKHAVIPMTAEGVDFAFSIESHMLIAKDKGGVVYVDISRDLKDEADEAGKGRLNWLGTLEEKSTFKMFNGNDPAALKDALTRSGFSDVEKIIAKAVDQMKKDSSGDYQFTSHYSDKKKVVTYKSKAKEGELWPAEDGIRDRTDSANSGEAGATTPNSVLMDGMSLSDASAGFKAPRILIDGHKDITAAKDAAKSGAMLYVAKGEKGEKQEWYLQFMVEPIKGKPLISSHIKVFQSPADKEKKTTSRTMYPGDGITIQLLDLNLSMKEFGNKKVPETLDQEKALQWVLKIIDVPGKDLKDAGVLAVFDKDVAGGQHKGVLGVVAFWGVDAKAAATHAKERG